MKKINRVLSIVLTLMTLFCALSATPLGLCAYEDDLDFISDPLPNKINPDVSSGVSSGSSKITGGNGLIPLMYNINDGAVELFLTDKEISDIIDATADNISVFDLSLIPNFTSVRMPKDALQKLSGAVDGLSVQLKAPKGILSFDAGALKSIISQSGAYINFSLTEVKYDSLNAAQKSAINPDSVIVNASVVSDAKAIRSFDGSLTIYVPYTGLLPVKAWYLSDDGVLEDMTGIYNATTKMMLFKASHLSLFVIGKELPQSGIRIRLAIGSIVYTVGETADKLDVAPTIVNDRTMVPLRFIAEAMGAKVDWNENTRSATIELDGKTISVTIDKIEPGMDVPAMIIGGRTMVPLRYIGEALGCEVSWNPDTNVISIDKK